MKTLVHVSLLIFTLLYASDFFAGENKVITGNVFDESGDPLPSVNIYILESSEGTSSDHGGKFKLSTSRSGVITLAASMVGYSKFQQQIDLSSYQRSINLNIEMEVESIELEETVVMGSSFSSESGKGVVINSVDVMTTPGGAADLYQSLKTMPGLTQVSESAELYVRGGDPTETVTLIDQASIYHPYTYESAYGGLFSNLNTGAVSEMYFSSGGFSAKYGNVLSGVLDIQTKDRPTQTGFSLGLSMAAASLAGEVPLVTDKLGFRFYGQQSYTKPIMWLNNSLDEFTVQPTSRNLTASLVYRISETGKLKLTTTIAGDRQGVKVERAEFNGVFDGNSQTNFYNLQLTELIGKNTLLKSSLSYSSHNNDWKLGVLDLNKNDRAIKSRTDIEHTLTKNIQFSFGAEFENRRKRYIGTIPNVDYDYRPEANKDVLNESVEENRIAAYVEVKKLDLFGLKNLYLVIGFRSDYFTEFDVFNFDQRYGLGYRLSDKSKLRASFGTFHQLPDFRLFAAEDGNPNLESMGALHYVVSYDYELDKNNSFRIELFHKDYSDLPLENDQLNYDNRGHGFASGLDLIFKGELPLNIDGWISYGYIDTKRKWMDFENLSRSSFDITHNLSMVMKYNFSAIWQVGLNFKYATGRPFTPVVGSEYNSNIDLYEPIYGNDNSERYPDYKRLDLRVTHLNRIFDNFFAIFYLEALNILDINNLFGYTHNQDYSRRKRVQSYFGRRTLVMGTVITF